MSLNINPYLTFGGNCHEAMTFYHSIFGGELVIQKVGETPLADKIPSQMHQKVLHSTLISGNMTIMASDMVANKGLIVGNHMCISMMCENEEQIRSFYEKLAESGSRDHELEFSFWGALFGDLTDKYGIRWMLSFPLNQN